MQDPAGGAGGYGARGSNSYSGGASGPGGASPYANPYDQSGGGAGTGQQGQCAKPDRRRQWRQLQPGSTRRGRRDGQWQTRRAARWVQSHCVAQHAQQSCRPRRTTGHRFRRARRRTRRNGQREVRQCRRELCRQRDRFGQWISRQRGQFQRLVQLLGRQLAKFERHGWLAAV